ncbi:hypothetical protein [Roseomonas sp. BN140053]|uniref:hypothetical protein n=1 Tax=Roseomonas sp. BN140053 TaxID=3391898 RepID=UPI0039EC41F5
MDFSNKTAAELRTMVDNAARASAVPKATAQRLAAATALREAAEAELARRGPAARPRGALTPEAELVGAAKARLVAAAGRAAAAFDLSPERANTRTPHALLGKDGGPKLGGRARSKQVRRDLYISYRNGDRVAALTFLLRDAEDTEGSWEGGAVVPGQQEPAPGGYAGPDAEAAEAAFTALLEQIAPKRD